MHVHKARAILFHAFYFVLLVYGLLLGIVQHVLNLLCMLFISFILDQ